MPVLSCNAALKHILYEHDALRIKPPVALQEFNTHIELVEVIESYLNNYVIVMAAVVFDCSEGWSTTDPLALIPETIASTALETSGEKAFSRLYTTEYRRDEGNAAVAPLFLSVSFKALADSVSLSLDCNAKFIEVYTILNGREAYSATVKGEVSAEHKTAFSYKIGALKSIDGLRLKFISLKGNLNTLSLSAARLYLTGEVPVPSACSEAGLNAEKAVDTIAYSPEIPLSVGNIVSSLRNEFIAYIDVKFKEVDKRLAALESRLDGLELGSSSVGLSEKEVKEAECATKEQGALKEDMLLLMRQLKLSGS